MNVLYYTWTNQNKHAIICKYLSTSEPIWELAFYHQCGKTEGFVLIPLALSD